jgi:hypothetical protein
VQFSFRVGNQEPHQVDFSFDQFVGNLELHQIAIEKKRKLFLAGLRPQRYRIFIDGQLAQTYEGS